MKKSNLRRNILALSGGKDSAALAVYLKDRIPDLEYVFLDTGHELPETYEFLNRMRALLGIHIERLWSKKDFDYWLRIYNGCLPSPKNRWCTKQLKIRPFESYISRTNAYSYIALRADEDRQGYISHKDNIVPIYPFIEDGLTRNDIIQILEESGLGLPKYYEWRSRSGCYFCFFQRKKEWVGLKDNHSELFIKATEYETNHSDGRTYTWVQGESLNELIKRRNDISDYEKKDPNGRKLLNTIGKYDFKVGMNSILQTSENEEDKPCLICDL